MSLKAANTVSVQETQDLFTLAQVNESLRALLIVWMEVDVRFNKNILSKTLADHSKLILRACLFIGQLSARTANNPIEKLARSPVRFSPLMNNSAVRVKAGRGDLVGCH